MMEKTIKNLPSQIENCMDHFIDDLDISKLVRKDAILSLQENSNQGSIYFATTNYQDLAFRFIQKVSQHYNIKNIEKVNGSIINWNHRSIQHFNCGPLKLIHLNHLKIIDLSYGDDPFYNDAYILNAAKKGFTITTKKNSNYNTNYRLNWN